MSGIHWTWTVARRVIVIVRLRLRLSQGRATLIHDLSGESIYQTAAAAVTVGKIYRSCKGLVQSDTERAV